MSMWNSCFQSSARAALFLTIFCGAAPSVSAHRLWLLPSSTVLSGDEGWVTVDAAVSNTLFVFEHRPLRLDGLGWTVAALLYLRLRIERAHRLRRPGDLGPSAGTDPTCTRERGEPDGD
jgi:hypothetical protein